MLKYFVFVFYFVFNSLTYAAVELYEKLGTQIGRHLYRAVTQRGGLLEPVAHGHRFLFSNGHWVKGLSHEPKDKKDPLTVAEARNFLLSPQAETEQFHTKLARKIIEAFNRGEVLGAHSRGDMLQRSGKVPLLVYNQTPRAFKFERDVQPNFLNGHCLTATVKTRCPKVLVNLYEEKEGLIAANDPSYPKWFMPVEQTLFCPTLDGYKRNLAILTRWAAYSRFVLMVIPENTEVRVHIGIAAPQNLVENEMRERLIKSIGISGYQAEVDNRIERARNYLKIIRPGLTDGEIEAYIHRFCEFFPGGATQVFVEYAKDYYLFDIDGLYNSDGTPFAPRFSTQKNGKDWAVPPISDESHFLHNTEAVQVRMHEGLQRLFSNGQFDGEKADIDKILAHFGNHLTPNVI